MIRKMINTSNRRRLIRFNLLRQQLCPLCDNIIYFENKENIYKCKNTDCDYRVEKELSIDDENLEIENEIKSSL